MDLKNKKVTIIGAVRSGLAAAKLVKEQGGIPFVSDSSAREQLLSSISVLDELKIDYEVGEHTDLAFACDLMVVSPGVPLTSPVILKANDKDIKMISEVELAYQFCNAGIAAITGTNGKTTTTALTEFIFKTAGFNSFAAGNIGKAFSEVVSHVSKNDLIALEVSSYQLDLIDEFKPKAAAILNVTPDHLNRYNFSFENYINSKLGIYKNFGENELLILNADDISLISALKELPKNVAYFSLKSKHENGCYVNNEFIVYVNNGIEENIINVDELFIKGEHNIQNAMAAILLAKAFDIKTDAIAKALRDFKGVEHRLEFVREIDGVKYINDSKATNVDSVWYALRSFDEPIFLILGGQDVGNDYHKIKDEVLNRAKKIYAIGSSANLVFNFFHKDIKVEIKKTLEEAVSTANSEAREGEIVLLSPACKSFDQFKSFEHRGEVFKDIVNKL